MAKTSDVSLATTMATYRDAMGRRAPKVKHSPWAELAHDRARTTKPDGGKRSKRRK